MYGLHGGLQVESYYIYTLSPCQSLVFKYDFRSLYRSLSVYTCLTNLHQLLAVSSNHWMSLVFSTGHCQSLAVTAGLWQSPLVTTSHQQCLVITACLWQSPVITVSHYWKLVVSTSHYQSLVVTVILWQSPLVHYRSLPVCSSHCMSPLSL